MCSSDLSYADNVSANKRNHRTPLSRVVSALRAGMGVCYSKGMGVQTDVCTPLPPLSTQLPPLRAPGMTLASKLT